VSEAYSDALAITIVALGALIIISFFFIGLTRCLGWLARRGVKEVAVSAPGEAQRRQRALIATAALMRYLGAERRSAPGREGIAAKPKPPEQEEEK